jgi:hypothetical protein
VRGRIGSHPKMRTFARVRGGFAVVLLICPDEPPTLPCARWHRSLPCFGGDPSRQARRDRNRGAFCCLARARISRELHGRQACPFLSRCPQRNDARGEPARRYVGRRATEHQQTPQRCRHLVGERRAGLFTTSRGRPLPHRDELWLSYKSGKRRPAPVQGAHCEGGLVRTNQKYVSKTTGEVGAIVDVWRGNRPGRVPAACGRRAKKPARGAVVRPRGSPGTAPTVDIGWQRSPCAVCADARRVSLGARSPAYRG